MFSNPKFLAIYSGSVTAAALILLMHAFAPFGDKKARFEEITVQRINVVEPDGTLRMVMTNKTFFPGNILKGKDHPNNTRPRTAGVLFYNDEGTENGGLVFAGAKGPDGKISAGGGLSFDQYEQDQVLQLLQYEVGGQRYAGFKVNDAPDISMDYAVSDTLDKMKDGPAKEVEKAKYQKTYGLKNRIFIGKRFDHSVSMELRDQEERARIIIKVTPEGTPIMQFLDEKGKITSQLPPLKRM